MQIIVITNFNILEYVANIENLHQVITVIQLINNPVVQSIKNVEF